MELLREAINRLGEDMNRRLDDHAKINSERHQQNVEVSRGQTVQLGAIDRDVRSMNTSLITLNGTVISHTSDLVTHAADLKELFDRPTLTLANLRWYVAIFVAGVVTVVGTLSALISVLHAFKLLPGQ